MSSFKNIFFLTVALCISLFSQDSTGTASELKGPVKYKADKISMDPENRRMLLRGNAWISYEKHTLTAGKILIDWTNNLVYAEPDTVVDSTGVKIPVNYPAFIEAGKDTLYASLMIYNISTQQGKLFEGRGRQNNNYFRGEKIRKLPRESLLIRSAGFTTCDLDTPHYYFYAGKMKMDVDDKIVAKDIALLIEGLPLAYIPFGVFPNKSGRTSGFLLPRYEESPTRGRTLRNIGYYWAINDYMDATFSADFFEKRSFLYRGEFRYRDRYRYNGYVKGEFSPLDLTTGKPINRWSFWVQHNQKISPNTNLSARGQFVSDNSYYNDNYATAERRLDQQLSNTLTYSTRWPDSKNSLNINIQSQQNLVTSSYSYTLPDIRFSHSQRPLFGEAKGEKNFYHNIYYSYNLSMKNSFFRSEEQTSDSTARVTEKDNRGVLHYLNFSAPSKIFKYITFSPSLTYQELWQDRHLDKHFENGELVTDEVPGFSARRTFNAGINIRTTLYGVFPLRVGKLRSIRHKVDPQIRFSYQPDFSESGWGYYGSYIDTLGNEIKYDRFGNSIYGGTPSGKRASMTFSLANLFQAKSIENGNEVKTDLFRANLAGSYNFVATGYKLSDISATINSSAIKKLNFQAAFLFSPYKYADNGAGKKDEYLGWDGGLLRLVTFNTSAGISLTGKELSKSFTTLADSLENEEKNFLESGDVVSKKQRDDVIRDLKAGAFSWTLRGDISYRYDANNRYNHISQLNFIPSVTLTLTENWRIRWNASMDLTEWKINYQRYSIYRDLHCWELSFDWSPNPDYPSASYFYLRIGIKDPILKDLKLEQRNSNTPYF
jgi:lipopolysaccharide assembly outer membrane protein LptD (OstA)